MLGKKPFKLNKVSVKAVKCENKEQVLFLLWAFGINVS